MNIKEVLVKDKKNMIICPSSYNEGIFKSVGDEYLYNLTFETPEKFIDSVLGTYYCDLIMKLEEGADEDFGQLNVSGAKELINVSPFLDDKDFKDKHSDYFAKNDGYIECLKEMNVIYTDYCLTIPKFHLVLNEIKKYNIIPQLLSTQNVNQNIFVVKNDNIIEEVENMVDLVSDLLYKGKDINNILVYCSSEDYYSIFEDVLSYTDIPYQIEKKISLLETNDGLAFYKYAKSCMDEAKDDSENKNERSDGDSSKESDEDSEDESMPLINLEFFLDYKKLNPNMNIHIYNTLVSFFSGIEYASIDYLKEFLIETNISLNNYKNVLRITSNFDKYISEDKILFMCGINQGAFPTTIRYNGLITDEIIKKRNIPTSKKINEYNEIYIKNKIYSIKEVYISYTLKNMTKELSISPFIAKLDNKQDINKDNIVGYSERRDWLKYLKAKDTYDFYRSQLPNLEKYDFLTEKYKIEEYSSDFLFDKKDTFNTLIKNTLKLSPTSINDYVDCPFKYFFKSVYRLEQFNVKFGNYLGLFFHDYISKYIDKEYSKAVVDLCFEKFRKKTFDQSKYELSSTEKIFFDIFLEYLPTLHDYIRKYFNKTNLELIKEEPLEKIIQTSGPTIKVKGTADLIVKNKNDNSVYVFDYKTGDYSTLNIEKKKGLQMFIYMDALLNNDDYKGSVPLGMFYIIINHKPSEIDATKDISFSGYSALEVADLKSLFNNQKITKRLKDTIGCVDDLKLRMEDVNGIVDEIKKDILDMKFKQTPSTDACAFCRFNEFCYSKKVSEFGDDGDEEDSTDGN